jgi:DNA-binding MarR family transcriptional regulator
VAENCSNQLFIALPALPELTALNQTPSRRLATLDDLLLFRVARLSADAGAMVVRLCEGGYGITRREWRLMVALQLGVEMQPSALAAEIHLDRARTSKALGSLRQKGLVARVAVAGDGRSALVSLTDAGRAVCDDLLPQVRRINETIVATLNDTEAATFDRYLSRLHEAAATLSANLDTQLPRASRRLGRGNHLPRERPRK